MSSKRRFGAAITVAALLSTLAIVPANAAAAPYAVVLDGLNSPRGLSFGPGGHLFVGIAGNGEPGSSSIIEINNPLSMNATGKALVSELSSIGEEGEFIGVDGVSATGHGTNGSVYGIMAIAPELGGDEQWGSLLKVSLNGDVETVANVGSFMFQWTTDHIDLSPVNPDGTPRDFPDANPYAVLAVDGHVYVADAGANTLLEVHPDGSIDVLAFFANLIIADSTPTCIAKGPDGALYVGTLSLVDSLVFGPSAIVYRVDVAETDPDDLDTILSVAEPWATGLWPINGCAFGPDGTFYASELLTNPEFAPPHGDVVKIPWGSPETHISLTDGALSFAAGVAVGPNGAVYVANGTAFVESGEIVRLTNR